MRARMPFAWVVAFLAFSLASAAETDPQGSDLQKLANWMTGTFRNQAHAPEGSKQRDLRLVVTPIWKDREGGPWLYVEQAAADKLDKPYRQRVYQLIRTAAGTFESRVFALPEPGKHVAAWKQENPLGDVKLDQLVPRSGCSVVLKKDGEDRFVGGTQGISCKSELPETAYTTSQVEITAKETKVWDRGFDVSGKQVRGLKKGPTVFVRQP